MDTCQYVDSESQIYFPVSPLKQIFLHNQISNALQQKVNLESFIENHHLPSILLPHFLDYISSTKNF